MPLTRSCSLWLAALLPAALLLSPTSGSPLNPAARGGLPERQRAHPSRRLLQFDSGMQDETPQLQMDRILSRISFQQQMRMLRQITPSSSSGRRGVDKERGSSEAQRGDSWAFRISAALKQAAGGEAGKQLSAAGLPKPSAETSLVTASHSGSAEQGSQGSKQPPERRARPGPQMQVLSQCQLVTLGGRKETRKGERYGAWTLCGNGVREGMVVYSFGMGSDVSFDWALLQKGARVFAFDPTKTRKYAEVNFKRLNVSGIPPDFTYKQVGIGPKDETAPFFKSTAKGVGSMSAVPLAKLTGYGKTGYSARLQTLATCRRQQTTEWIHVLKIDAEGLELDLCESVTFLEQLAHVTQLLIEFHDRMVVGGHIRKQTCIKRLQKLGFKAVHQTSKSRGVSFARLEPSQRASS